MKITKILKALLIALSIVMIFSLVACDPFDSNAETSETESENVSESASESESDSESVPGSEQASENESESDSTSESESESTSVSESTSESEEEECKHTNTALNDKCDKVCSDCGVTVATKQHVAGAPDAADKCNVKCTNCGELMEANKHTKGEPDANDNCNVKCTVCGDLLEEGKHQRGDGQPDKNDGCKIKCPVCSTALSVRHGETATVWAPILGVNEDGNLYESKNCVDCGTPRETRVVAKAGWLNTVKVNGVEIAKSQAVGTVLTLEDGKNSSDGVFTAGWVAIVGGVDRYVYRVVDANGNASAWASVVYSAALADANQAIIDSVNGNKLGMTDFTANASFANGMKTGDLSAYIGQTVTIEFGAVPANNKGTDEAPNAIVIGTVKNLNVVCYHGDNENEYVLNANDPQWLVSESCSVCGEPNVKALASETLKGNYLFNPSYIASKKGTLMTEDGFTFVRITPNSLTSTEENFYLYSSDTAITNAAGYLAILYRSSVHGNELEIFINSTSKTIAGGDNKNSGKLSKGDEWQLVIIDVTAKNSFDRQNVKGLRFDYINGKPAMVEGDYIDIGFITFFESTDDAYAYYAAYVSAYLGEKGCAHPANAIDGVWKAVEGQPGMIAQTCTYCQGAVNVSACLHTDSKQLTNITPLENDPIFSATADCALCGKSGVKIVSDTTSSGLHVFTPDYLASKIGSVKTDENGLSYVQITSPAASGEKYVTIFSNANEPMTNVGRYIAILYRSTVTDFFDFYIDSTTTSISATARTSTMGPTGDTWRLIIQDTSGISNKYDGKKLVALRFDYFNDSKNRTAEDHIDVAYIAFFSTIGEAEAYYAAYVAEYLGVEGCSHKFTSDWAKTEEEGIIKNTCAWCEGEIVKACEHNYGESAWTKGEEEGTLKNTCVVCDVVVVKACEHSFDDSKWILNEETGLVKNTCLVCEMLLEFVCEHKDKLVCVFNGDGTYKYICDVCKQDAGITNESHTVFMPDYLAGKLTTKSHVQDAMGADKAFANILALTDPNYNNLPYTRVQVHTATDREAYIYLNFNPTQKNVGKYVAIIYRSNGLKTHEMFISAGAGVAGEQNTTIPWGSSFSTAKWTYAVFDFSAKTNWDSNTGIGTIRWDIDNGTKVGNYLDIAYLGFFNTQAEADAFYAAYSEQYDLDYTFRGHIDFVYIGPDNDDKVSMTSTLGAGAINEYDFTGKTLTATNDVRFQGWFLSSKGVTDYTVVVTDQEGNELKNFKLVGSDHGAVYNAYGNSAPYNYGTECGKGATFDQRIQLSGCEGKVVNVVIYANTVDGHTVKFISATNITVPAAAAAE